MTIALLELESLEQRMQLAYRRDEIPSETAADLSLARLMATELDGLLRTLDLAIGDTSRYFDVYSDTTYKREGLIA